MFCKMLKSISMKIYRMLFFFFLLVSIQNIYSQTDENTKSIEHLLEVSYRFIFPELHKPKLMVFFDLGVGWHYEIIPKIFSPGIYADIGVGYDWIRIFSEEKSDDEKKKMMNMNNLG